MVFVSSFCKNSGLNRGPVSRPDASMVPCLVWATLSCPVSSRFLRPVSGPLAGLVRGPVKCPVSGLVFGPVSGLVCGQSAQRLPWAWRSRDAGLPADQHAGGDCQAATPV
jgi:hypothetical protein